MKEQRKPTCYVIAGPNGAGKTTFALKYLPGIAGCRDFVNADLIASGLAPLNSISAQFDAARIFLSEIRSKIARRIDFAFEATFAGKTHVSLLKNLGYDGWRTVLFFLWIPDADFSKDRVRQRVRDGGHDVPDDVIYRRYPRIMHNLVNLYIDLFDNIYCYDNSDPQPVLIFEHDTNGDHIIDRDIYNTVFGYPK